MPPTTWFPCILPCYFKFLLPSKTFLARNFPLLGFILLFFFNHVLLLYYLSKLHYQLLSREMFSNEFGSTVSVFSVSQMKKQNNVTIIKIMCVTVIGFYISGQILNVFFQAFLFIIKKYSLTLMYKSWGFAGFLLG